MEGKVVTHKMGPIVPRHLQKPSISTTGGAEPGQEPGPATPVLKGTRLRTDVRERETPRDLLRAI